MRLPSTRKLSLVAVSIAAAIGGTAAAQDSPWGPAGDGILPGWKIIEGCIVVREDFDGTLAGTYANNFWPGGVIPYVFDANVSALNQQRSLDAMAEIEAVANVDWRPFQAGDFDWVVIRNSTRNNSPVGRQGGPQILNMTSWNQEIVIVHEMYHAMGFWHEQSRADRGNYVTIEWDNIQDGSEHNFEIRPNGGEYGPYDFDSMMHYDACSFSTDCPPGFTCDCADGTETILALPAYASQQDLMGQRDHISYLDATTLSFIYPFANWRFCSIGYNGLQLGTFFFPYKQFNTGFTNTPSGGRLNVQPGTYAAVGIWDKSITITAPIGGVTLTN